MVLLVIDTQKGITDDRLYEFDKMRANIKELIALARENGKEVIYVQHDDGPGSGFTKGEKTVMVVGIMTNFCIDATIRTGFDNGFEVLVPEYTNSTYDNDFMDRATCYRYYNEFMWEGRYAKCITMEDARNRIRKS